MSKRQAEIPPLTRGMLRAQERCGRSIRGLIVEDYEAMTTIEMAAKYGVSHVSVLEWMARLGIERRLPGQRPPLRANGH